MSALRVVRNIAALATIASVASCSGATAPARAQWKVFLGTDASVPQFGEQVLVEVLGPDGTSTTQRLLDGSQPERWPLSFGVLPSATSTITRLRVRFFRTAITGSDGLPSTSALIDALVTLPPVRAGVTLVGVNLPMACFGVASDVSAHATCDPATGELADEPTLSTMTDTRSLALVGSWPNATHGTCPTDVPAGMTCVRAGAFILGSPHYPPTSSPPLPERAVRVSSFAIDNDEFTVGQYRRLVNTKGLPQPVVRGSINDSSLCDYVGASDSSADALPVNCVSWSSADKACAALNKRLPTEAEWEFAAGNLELETPYPWGKDGDVCSHAVVARGRKEIGEAIECLVQGGVVLPPGPVAGGSSQDVTALGLRNMGGNLGEWVADQFNSYSAPCWTPVDPLCSTDAGRGHTLRGGAWNSSRSQAAVFIRDSTRIPDAVDLALGFRCARTL